VKPRVHHRGAFGPTVPAACRGSYGTPRAPAVPGASVSLLSPLGAIAAAGTSDAEGAFRFDAVPSGSYVLTADSPGFATGRLAVRVEADRAREALAVDRQPEEFRDQVTVTAIPGRAAALEDVAQRVNVIDEEEIALRAKAALARAASEEVGLHLQRTSPTIAGVFVRGLLLLEAVQFRKMVSGRMVSCATGSTTTTRTRRPSRAGWKTDDS